MNFNSLLGGFVALVLLAIAIVFGVTQCQDRVKVSDQRDTLLVNNDRLTVNNAGLKLVIAQKQEREALNKAAVADLNKKLEAQTDNLSALVGKTSQQGQRLSVLTGLVANRSLPAGRLRDTLYVNQPGPVQADSELVAAVDKSLKWAKLYKQQRDSLAAGLTSRDGEVSDLERTLNGYAADRLNIKSALLDEAVKSRVLGFGRKRAMRKLAAGIK